MPDRMPDRMPEDMSDRMPKDLPVTKRINVMVGMTRSKVFFSWVATIKVDTVLRQRPSENMLLNLQRALVKFLAEGLYDYVTGTDQDLHDVSKAPPSRRLSVGPVGNSVSMPVENIWEVLDHAQTTGKSARQALEFCQTRLSNAGGCSANSADSWVRRRQIIYDSRVVASLVGACHFNLVSDCSQHSGKDRRGPQSLDLGR